MVFTLLLSVPCLTCKRNINRQTASLLRSVCLRVCQTSGWSKWMMKTFLHQVCQECINLTPRHPECLPLSKNHFHFQFQLCKTLNQYLSSSQIKIRERCTQVAYKSLENNGFSIGGWSHDLVWQETGKGFFSRGFGMYRK